MLLRHIGERQQARQSGDEVLRFVHFFKQSGEPFGQKRLRRRRGEEQAHKIRKDAQHIQVSGLRVVYPVAVQQLSLYIGEILAGEHTVQRKRGRVEYGAVHAEIRAKPEKHAGRDADIDHFEIRVVEKLVFVHVIRTDQDERTRRQKLGAPVDRMDGAALRHEKQLVKIVRMDLIGGLHAELVQRAAALTAQVVLRTVQLHNFIGHGSHFPFPQVWSYYKKSAEKKQQLRINK